VRAAIDRELPPMQRAAAHRAAAQVRFDLGSGVDTVVAHLQHVEPAADAWVASMLIEGARSALARSAPGSALTLLDRALAEPPPPALRFGVLRDAAFAALAVGRPDSAARLQRAMDETVDPLDAAPLARALGSVLMLGGQVDAATAVLEQAIAELPADANDTGLALELDLWRVSQFGLVVRQRATARHPRFTPTPGTPPGPGWLARDGIELALTRGPAPDAAALAHRALANGRLLDAEGSESPIFQMAANTLILAGETTAARDAYDEAIAQATRRGSIRGFALCNVFRALLHRDAGNLADAEADARAYLEHAHAAGPAHRLAVAALVVVMLERGDPDDAAAVLHEQAPEPGDEASAGHLLQARARLCIAFGRTDEALAALEELAEHERAWGIGTPAMTQWRAYAAEVHTARGDTATARTLADEEVERARQFGAAGVLGTALLAAATVDEPAMRVERLREAVACLAPSPARLRHAQALISLGSELRRAGQRVEARPLLTGGVALARACGAIALAEHGYDELAAAGSRPRRLLRTGVDALTPSERRVAQMAAAGSSNRDIAQALFLSVRTVETHLARDSRRDVSTDGSTAHRCGGCRARAGWVRDPIEPHIELLSLPPAESSWWCPRCGRPVPKRWP
jgi:DNA-binding CsgD family transcriptional regulator/predicted negative regulator of RcsB-dependent stress response